MAYIRGLHDRGRHVLMVGDGLNDAGALKAAEVGVSVSEDINTFSPACDAILSAERFHHFDRFLRFARTGMRIVYASFGLSIAYNIVGLSFAVTGNLSPLVSAVLMPVSSVTVVAFTTIAARLGARRIGLH
jgi:Cu+-exporting ATPase